MAAVMGIAVLIMPILAEAAPALEDAQQQLHQEGFYTGQVDGRWGPETAKRC